MVTQWQAGNAKRRNLPELRDALPGHVAISNPLDLRDAPAASIMSKRWTFCSTARILCADGYSFAQRRCSRNRKRARLIEAVKHHPRSKYVSLLTNCAASTPRKRHDVYSAKPGCRLPYSGRNHHCFYAYGRVPAYQKQLRETPALPSNLTSNTAERIFCCNRRLPKGLRRSIPMSSAHPASVWYEYSPYLDCQCSTEAVHIAEQIGYPVALKLPRRIFHINRKFRASCSTYVQQ